jgi:hypothetical protein
MVLSARVQKREGSPRGTFSLRRSFFTGMLVEPRGKTRQERRNGRERANRRVTREMDREESKRKRETEKERKCASDRA